MRTTPQQPNSNRLNDKKQLERPENKDNLDSRKNEEQLTKGKDVTHNNKEKHSSKKQGGA